MRLLLAEDETGMREAICDVLTYQQYEVTAAADGIRALELARNGQFDGILLDVMMPGMDGLTVLRALRRQGDQTPVLLLTARSGIEDRVEGLDAGADDYLPKPFAMDELLARIRAIVRRPQLAVQSLCVADLRLDEAAGMLICGNRSEPLSRLELQLMTFLMRNSGSYFSAEILLDRVWGIDSNAGIETVWVYISYLRKKLKTLGAHAEICSRRGVGYALERKKQ
ncbi:MAG: response regulator transcription factor [Clostridia bacterium]|nr:response regulator transcription factor [Clostridia bacterium]